MCTRIRRSTLFFFKDPATTEIYTLSLHDALPIYRPAADQRVPDAPGVPPAPLGNRAAALPAYVGGQGDRKSTRLNSSHMSISYAVFCLKKKNTPITRATSACISTLSATSIG